MQQCPACGGATTVIFSAPVAVTRRCAACGCIFNDMKAWPALFDAEYFSRNYVGRESVQTKESRWILASLRPYASAGSVLDVGCGTGMFLRAAREAGYLRNVGADISEAALAKAAANIGEGDALVLLPKQPIPERRYDVVALLDSIATLEKPADFLVRCRESYLTDGGILIIRTPHLSLPYRMFARVAGSVAAAFGIHPYFAPHRVVLFTQASLFRLLRREGFQIVRSHLRPDYFPKREYRSLRGLIAYALRVCLSFLNPSLLVLARKDASQSSGPQHREEGDRE